MTRLQRFTAGATVAGLVTILGAEAPVAAADKADKVDKKECAQAYVEGQKEMRSSTLRKARDHLRICAREECMGAVRKDCVTWLGEVTAAIPSIVIDAKDTDGKETVDVRMFIDNVLVKDKLDVQAIELDPGTLHLRFEHGTEPPIEKEVVLRQGQKNRVVDVSFAKASVAGAATGGDAAVGTGDATKPNIIPWVIGGAGVLFLGGAGASWLIAESNRDDLDTAKCAPNCIPGDVDAVKTQRLIGDVLLGVGIVAIGVATYMLLTAPSSKPAHAATWLMPSGVRF